MKYAVLLYADAPLATGPGAPEWEASLDGSDAYVTAPEATRADLERPSSRPQT